ncbi:MAG: hypothetical protein KKI08_05340 [Armatimonadetes bacterium]|nr:hypothetical protein [Armatimonadota bacterium]
MTDDGLMAQEELFDPDPVTWLTIIFGAVSVFSAVYAVLLEQVRHREEQEERARRESARLAWEERARRECARLEWAEDRRPYGLRLRHELWYLLWELEGDYGALADSIDPLREILSRAQHVDGQVPFEALRCEFGSVRLLLTREEHVLFSQHTQDTIGACGRMARASDAIAERLEVVAIPVGEELVNGLRDFVGDLNLLRGETMFQLYAKGVQVAAQSGGRLCRRIRGALEAEHG